MVLSYHITNNSQQTTHNMIKHLRYIIIVAALAISLIACNNKKEDSKPLVTVSILPQKYFVEQIAGELVNVNVMIPPGASPATYEPSPKQIQGLTKSSLYLRIGYIEFEKGWMDRFESVNAEMKILNTSKGIDLIAAERHVHGDHVHLAGIDPHVWASPKTSKMVIENTYNELLKLLPNDQEVLKKNYLVLEKRVNELDKQIVKCFLGVEGKSFFIYHPALGYLARDYGLEQVAIEYEGKEPSPAHMKELVDQAKQENIKVIFIQSQFNTENARAIADEIEGSVIAVDPLSEDWHNNLIEMTDKMAKAMK